MHRIPTWTCNITKYQHKHETSLIPDAWVKELWFWNFLWWFFMHCLELFSLLGADICLQSRHVMLQLNGLPCLHVNRSTLGIQDHRRWSEHHRTHQVNWMIFNLTYSLWKWSWRPCSDYFIHRTTSTRGSELESDTVKWGNFPHPHPSVNFPVPIPPRI